MRVEDLPSYLGGYIHTGICIRTSHSICMAILPGAQRFIVIEDGFGA